mmetsp:Transcript_135740/g.247532  ORF Transcript_135740/g.247532 Transcript_135740/m.247532 type:complete len:104 (+) Transcript_135740:3-314(+)
MLWQKLPLRISSDCTLPLAALLPCRNGHAEADHVELQSLPAHFVKLLADTVRFPRDGRTEAEQVEAQVIPAHLSTLHTRRPFFKAASQIRLPRSSLVAYFSAL